jgi:hypothetical protein
MLNNTGLFLTSTQIYKLEFLFLNVQQIKLLLDKCCRKIDKNTRTFFCREHSSNIKEKECVRKDGMSR